MRIATTTLESYRLWRFAVIPEDKLIAQIRGVFEPTPRILLGQAYGRVLEQPDAHRVPGGYARDGYRFEEDAVAPALAYIDRRGVFEVKATRRYGAHTVVSKADHLLGTVLSEFKTRVGRCVLERYAASYQWRFMADMFAPSSIVYRVFLLSEDPIALRAVRSLELSPYPSLHDDCCELLAEFVAYVRRRNLEAYLPDRVGELEGAMFEDAPTRPSRAKQIRQLRDEVRFRREQDDPLPMEATVVRPLAPVAELPVPRFTLSPSPAGRLEQRTFAF